MELGVGTLEEEREPNIDDRSTAYHPPGATGGGAGGAERARRVPDDGQRLLFFSSRRRHTRSLRDWSSDVCSSDLLDAALLHFLRDGFEQLRGSWVQGAGLPVDEE